MKKVSNHLVRRLFTACLLSLWGLGGFAQSVIGSGYCGAEGDSTNLTWVLTSDSVLSIYGSGKMADYNSYTPPYPPWGYHYTQMRTIIIGDSVTTIGTYAFSGSPVNSISISNSVTNIGNSAFSDSWITSVIIGNSVTTIGNGAFADCSNLNSVIIPNSVTTIGSAAFGNAFDANMLVSVTIPNSVTTLGSQAFSRTPLVSVAIGDGLTHIADGVFYKCGILASLTIGKNVTQIDNEAFNNCYLPSLIIPDKVIYIGTQAFEDCGIIHLTMGKGMSAIANGAFNNCTSLSTITVSAEKPPAFGGYNVFVNVDTTIPVYVPCESIPSYQSDAGWSYFSNYHNIPFPALDSPSVIQQNNAMVITWQNTGAPLYEIYRNNILLKTVSATTYTDTDLEEDKEYCYQIKSIEEGCESELSGTVCQTYKNVGIISIRNEGLRITNTNYELRITNYELQPLNIELFDVMGRNVGATLAVAQAEIVIDISHLQSGIYFLRINSKINKLIINKFKF